MTFYLLTKLLKDINHRQGAKLMNNDTTIESDNTSVDLKDILEKSASNKVEHEYIKIEMNETMLRRVSAPVETDDVSMVNCIKQQLKEATEQRKQCIGLAGVQIGYLIRLSYLTLESGVSIFIQNPEIIEQSNEIMYWKAEGCTSFPGKFCTTKRHAWVIVKDDINGEQKYTGRDSVAISHEIDHMNGALFFDHLAKKKFDGSKIGRNAPCPCKSGKKFKKCCMNN